MSVEKHVALKLHPEVDQIRKSCRIASDILRSLERHVEPGISTAELDRIAAGLMRERGARPALDRRFPGSVCISVDEAAAHGIPSAYRLASGDTLVIDIAICHEGWCGDAAWTYGVGKVAPSIATLLEAALEATLAGAGAAKAGARMGDIGSAIVAVAGRHGCSILAELVGHGIGRKLHEDPVVPHTGRAGEGMRLVPGMVLTIEPVLSLGCGQLRLGEDGWSMVTTDRARVAQFEHTVAIFRDSTQILTQY